jgi:hypothetical protein
MPTSHNQTRYIKDRLLPTNHGAIMSCYLSLRGLPIEGFRKWQKGKPRVKSIEHAQSLKHSPVTTFTLSKPFRNATRAN